MEKDILMEVPVRMIEEGYACGGQKFLRGFADTVYEITCRHVLSLDEGHFDDIRLAITAPETKESE
jgi:hypothetical protein